MKHIAASGNAAQSRGGIYVLEDTTDAQRLADALAKHPDRLTAVDTETIGCNPKTQSPVGNSIVVCWSLAFRTAGEVKRYFIWWRDSEPLRAWLESDAPKTGHNIWTYDRHAFKNMGVELGGIQQCTARKARLWRSDKRFKVGLKQLMYQFWGYDLGKFDKLFSRPAAGKLVKRETMANSWRTVDGTKVRTTLGFEYQNILAKKRTLIPLDEIEERYPERLLSLYDYASLDAKAALEVAEVLQDKVDPKLWAWWNRGLQCWSDMERRGITIDVEQCNKAAARATQGAAELLPKLEEWSGSREMSWTSNKQISEFFYDYKCLPIPKVTGSSKAVKINREQTKSVSQASLNWLQENTEYHEQIGWLLDYKQKCSDATRVAKYPGFVNPQTGRVHCVAAPTTDTGRGAIKLPALQQVPNAARDHFGIRKCFVAAPGMTFVVADYSQLELYVLAHYLVKWFDDHRLKDALEGGDVHSWIAKQCWPRFARLEGNLKNHGPKAEKARSDVKNIVYGMNYGKTASGFGVAIMDAQGKPIGKKAAQVLMDQVMDALGVKRVQQRITDFVVSNGYVATLSGRRRPLKEAMSEDKYVRSRAIRQALNSPIQGGAADIVTQAMINVSDAGLPLVLQVHDELVIEVPKEKAPEAEQMLLECMTRDMFNLRLKLKADSGIAQSWGDAK